MDTKQLVVIGAGPGGYPAAFLAADLGMQVTLIDQRTNPGGECLYCGCIPSKALLHIANVLTESKDAARWGITFGEPKIDLGRVRTWKESVVQKLTGGLGQLSKQRKVNYIQGRAKFLDAHTVSVRKMDGSQERLPFEHAILAAGLRPATIPGLPSSPRIWDSTGALELGSIPKNLLVIGGGYIGLELGSVYAALGAEVSVVEMMPGLLPGADRDLVLPLAKRLEKLFAAIMLNTKVVEMKEEPDGIRVRLEGAGAKEPEQVYDRVLVSVGRKPNSHDLGLEATSVKTDPRGFVVVDAQRRTAEPSIFAIGDIAGEPMLAHKATHEGLTAVQVLAGKKAAFEPRAIPAVVYTDPEIAWCGLTETQAEKQKLPIKVARFPWAASGRSITLDRTDGVTKLIVDPETERVLGAGIAGPSAGELIAEATLAIEMGATAKDLALTIHPHPTLSETVMEAAEVFYGHCTHIYRRRQN
ncbi:MAG: dihydrolipoyl dehydrogenase [Verrucomicrobiota bacterium]